MTTQTTQYTVNSCLKLVGCEQLNACKTVDSTEYEGLSEYYNFTAKDIAYPGNASETAVFMLRLEFPTIGANGRYECQIGLAYIRQAKGKQFVAIKPTANQSDKEAFKNINSLLVDVEAMFEMGFLASDDKSVAAVRAWLTSGETTLRLAPVNANSYFHAALSVRTAGKNAAAYGTVEGALSKNPLGISTYWGEGFTPVSAKERNVMNTKKAMTGKKVSLIAPTAALPTSMTDETPVTAPNVVPTISVPVAPVAPVVPKSIDNTALIKQLKEAGFSLSEILAEIGNSANSVVTVSGEETSAALDAVPADIF